MQRENQAQFENIPKTTTLLEYHGIVLDRIDGHGWNCFRGTHDMYDFAQRTTLLQSYESPDEVKDALLNAIMGGRKKQNVQEKTYMLLLNSHGYLAHFWTNVLNTV